MAPPWGGWPHDYPTASNQQVGSLTTQGTPIPASTAVVIPPQGVQSAGRSIDHPRITQLRPPY